MRYIKIRAQPVYRRPMHRRLYRVIGGAIKAAGVVLACLVVLFLAGAAWYLVYSPVSPVILVR